MTATPAAPHADAPRDTHSLTDVHLDDKLSSVLGGKTAVALDKAFGFQTINDLLSHYPRRYARRGELTVLSELPLNEDVTIVAEVRQAEKRVMKTRKGTIVEVKITDGTGILTLTYFNQPWRTTELVPGTRGIFSGKVTDYRGHMQLTHPQYKLFTSAADEGAELVPDAAAAEWATAPIAIYPATGAVNSWDLHKSIELVLDSVGVIPDPIPPQVRQARGLLTHGKALEMLHRPHTDADWRAARDTLRFTEAFVLQTALLQQRARARRTSSTPRVPVPGGYLERFDATLPFALTGDQELVGTEIATDLAASWPMNRLVQGEVGSGKTLVALRAMLAVADSGGQSALLAPTEVLAAQHIRSIVKVLGPDLAAELMPTLLTGQLSTAERRKAMLRTVSGQSRIVIGTHALLGASVEFFDLGLVVVDEQHRFGVEQREALRVKGNTPPHVLVLTATPIPRTVAMTVFGDLEISTIAELPVGRAGIESFVVPLAEKPIWERRVWQRLAEELALGRQAFVVAPAITPRDLEEGDALEPVPEASDAAVTRQPTAVETLLPELRRNPALANARIEALHGRMTSDEKDQVMRSFAAGQIDVLVATTVIEVGVDVPNASAMVVMDAERFGVSQLHQLRGRVGRGSVPGICLLVTSAELETVARERVEAVAGTLDGFELAQTDLELRREGNVLGNTQSGARSALRLLRVATDGDLIADARVAAGETLDDDPDLAAIPALHEAVQRRLSADERASLTRN